MGESAGKRKERKASSRLQAVDGEWMGEWPVTTDIGRIGQMSQQELGGVVCDILTRTYAGESKSSGSKAKDPSHKLTSTTLKKIQNAAKKFKQRWVYIVNLPYCDDGHMISERQHFRYMLARELMMKSFSSEEELDDMLDGLIDQRLEQISERYK